MRGDGILLIVAEVVRGAFGVDLGGIEGFIGHGFFGEPGGAIVEEDVGDIVTDLFAAGIGGINRHVAVLGRGLGESFTAGEGDDAGRESQESDPELHKNLREK